MVRNKPSFTKRTSLKSKIHNALFYRTESTHFYKIFIILFPGIVIEDMYIYKFLILFDVLFGSVSIFSLSAISLERMYAVKYPANHHNLSNKPFFITIAMTWLIGVVMTGLKFAVDEKPYTMLILWMVFLLPLTIIVLCYFVIFYTARNMFVATNQEGNLSRDLQVAKTISIIIGLFVICWLPFFTINIVYYYGSIGAKKFIILNGIDLMSLTKGLHYANSMMNFFVYAVKSPDFRDAFKELLCNRFDGKVIRERLRTMSNAHLHLRNSLRVERLRKSPDSNDGRFDSLSKTTSINPSGSSSGSVSLLGDLKKPQHLNNSSGDEDCVFA